MSKDTTKQEIIAMLNRAGVPTESKEGKMTTKQRVWLVIERLKELELVQASMTLAAGQIAEGKYDFTKNTNTFVEMIAGYMTALLLQTKAKNYVEMVVRSKEAGELVFTLQQRDQKTAHELRREAEQELRALRDAMEWVTANYDPAEKQGPDMSFENFDRLTKALEAAPISKRLISESAAPALAEAAPDAPA